MSEQNILNPAQTSLLSPDWGYSEGLPETRSLFQAQSGKPYSRRQFVRGRIYELAWNNRDLATKHALQQWAQQYENDFFTLADWERSRYFTGRFEGPLTFNPVGNQQYNVKGRFIELPGLPVYAAPVNWARDAIFLEERNGFGEDLVKLVGTWGFGSDGFMHGLGEYQNGNTNTTDYAAWLYYGYGLRVWAAKRPTRGIMSFTVARIRDGAVAGPSDIDLYAAADTNSAAIWTVTNDAVFGGQMGLDLYLVKLQATNRKNASATALTIVADAIEVMQ